MNKILKLHQQYNFFTLFNHLMYKKTQFKSIPERISFPEQEHTTLKYWQENKCFEKQLQLTKHLPPYTFYDGPPFATGTPHYGHIAAGTIKDVVCRYAAQTGHHVSRRFGWDCHGLPVEYQIDKQLKITDKRQVLQMGIEKYNSHCRSIVMKYSNLWESVINRFGRWIDFKNDYKTLDIKFMESVWYVFKQLFEKGVVYRGRKIMPYSNACTTVLSNFQVQLNYKDVSDPSLYVNFPLVEDNNVKFMVWTTTPWTLPSNLALAVKPDMIYVKIKDIKRNQIFILAQCRLAGFYGKDKKAYQIIEKFKGQQLAGKQYVPMFDFFNQRKKDGCFKVQTAEFVTSDTGTGIVHCAPGFGQEDYKMCVAKGIIHPDDPPVPIDENGKFTKQVPTYEGIQVKQADKIIIKDLKQKGRVVQAGAQIHSYPFCWRSDTPLIYKAVSTWFIKVTDFKQDLVKNNHKAYWVPKTIQDKRFHNWLQDAKDWCFSRNRYWGNPIPLWVSDDGQQIVCIGSVKQLEELTGHKVTDLHREHIDHLTIQSKQGKGKLRRIQEVFDCWFESGSMPYAQVHYPFSTTEQQFQKIFPADFIGQGIDQTRGWFYTLNVISTGIKNMNPYKNLIVNGLVLTQDGKKMSKRLKNYPDPVQVCDQYGADAVRLYLINSPLVKAQNLNFSKVGVKAVIRDIFLPWYNAYRFLIQNISKWESKNNIFQFVENIEQIAENFNVTDKWIQSALQILIRNVRKQMSQYKLYNVVPQLISFLQILTNWYVRLNRLRLKGDVDELNMKVSLNVLFDVLLKVNVLMSPYVPFLTENMYQNMKLVIRKDSIFYKQSIHHVMISNVNEKLMNQTITEKMKDVMSIIETARKLRQNRKISLKQPIMCLTVINKSQAFFDNLKPFMTYIQEQINVADIKNVIQTSKYMKLEALPNLPTLGPKFKGSKDFKGVTDEIKKLTHEALQKCKQDGFVSIMGKYNVEIDDILIKEKFVQQNIQNYQAIGGDRVIIVLDTRQNQQLKIKGFARQIINRIQKLKKKIHLVTQDNVFIFYKFGQKAVNLNTALDKEFNMIQNAVKKVLLPVQKIKGITILGQDQGLIDEEQYQIFITMPNAIYNQETINSDFPKAGAILTQSVSSMPFSTYKDKESIKIILDGTQYVLVKDKHYFIHI